MRSTALTVVLDCHLRGLHTLHMQTGKSEQSVKTIMHDELPAGEGEHSRAQLTTPQYSTAVTDSISAGKNA